ncbi:hypothetical protein C2L66_11340 [Paraburkholderia caribensis]|nr:hypothetical protein C2L66_11340 [Paraburkholderia caribensis]
MTLRGASSLLRRSNPSFGRSPSGSQVYVAGRAVWRAFSHLRERERRIAECNRSANTGGL